MSDARGRGPVALGDPPPARSRHTGRRSAVALTDDRAFVGTTDGDLLARDRETLAACWRSAAGDAAVVAATGVPGGVAVGERGPAGEVRVHDRTGAVGWRHATAADVGDPAGDSRFEQPFVVDLASDGDRLYAAARRYERRGEDRAFASVVAAFEADGTVAWSRECDASPVALDARGDRLAVAYNRCPGDHTDGLVVHEAATGAVRWRWDPRAGGQRRVGDVSLLPAGLAVTSHADYRGYRLDPPDRAGAGGRGPPAGTVRWRVDLATPRDVGGETLYAYPNHVHATEAGVVFVTGNTYPAEGRSTASVHPGAHTAFGYVDGERAWSAPVGGFANGLATDGDSVAVPGAQRFRTRDPDRHGVGVFDAADGPRRSLSTDGVPTAAALDGDALAVVEEPVVYHDDGERLGEYRLHALSV